MGGIISECPGDFVGIRSDGRPVKPGDDNKGVEGMSTYQGRPHTLIQHQHDDQGLVILRLLN